MINNYGIDGVRMEQIWCVYQCDKHTKIYSFYMPIDDIYGYISIFWEVMLNGVVYNNSGSLEVDHQLPIRVFHEMDVHKKYRVGQLMIHITVSIMHVT